MLINASVLLGTSLPAALPGAPVAPVSKAGEQQRVPPAVRTPGSQLPTDTAQAGTDAGPGQYCHKEMCQSGEADTGRSP